MIRSLGRARLAVLGAAALFSTGGAAIKGTTLTAFQVAGFRSAVAALTLVALLPGARRGYSRALAPAALAYAGTLVCFVVATKLTTSAAAIFLQSTAPIWVLVLAPLLLGEQIRRRDLPLVALAGAGLLLVFLGSRDASATAPQPGIGNAAALASGLFYALLMLALRGLARGDAAGERALPATVLGNALAFALCLPWSLPVAAWTGCDVVAIVYLGTIQIGFAYWLFTRAIQVLPALEASLLVLLEPVLNPLWTWLLHGERPSGLAALGGTVMLLALAGRTLLERPLRAPGPPPPD
ncbi:MAG TPA: DMT family transporter [Thermoanaerobaculia bacterium]|jgi:drug/metabolite transporter (DMT)-like permease